MIKKTGLAIILGLILLFSVSAFARNDQNQYRKTPVIVDIKLKAPDLVPPAVQFAIFFKDPVSMFKSAITDQSVQNMDRQTAAENSWNRIFNAITGDCLYLLTMEPLEYSTVYEGKIWVVTKTVYIEKRPVCWCIPLEIKRGQEYQVVLSKSNRSNLEELVAKK